MDNLKNSIMDILLKYPKENLKINIKEENRYCFYEFKINDTFFTISTDGIIYVSNNGLNYTLLGENKKFLYDIQNLIKNNNENDILLKIYNNLQNC